MDPAHLHLMLNHVPVIGGIASLLVLAFGIATRSEDVKRAALLGFVAVALVTPVVVRSGEGAEEAVEATVGAAGEAYLHPHEEAGEMAQWILIATGVAALAALVVERRRKAMPAWAAIGTLVLGLAAAGAAARAAWLGGPIAHPELRAGAPAPADGGGEGGEREEHEERG